MPTPSSVAAALNYAQQLGLDLLDRQILLLLSLELPLEKRAWLYTHEQQLLTTTQWQNYISCCQRRARGEPLAYLTGRKEFYGLLFTVNPTVLIPRPDTEILVDWALELLAKHLPPAARVLDLGTGSGAIACAIKHNWPSAEVYAIERSQSAWLQAQDNARQLELKINFALGSWYQALQAPAKFDLIVANPPYIAEGDEHLAQLCYEPNSALVAANRGLADLEHIIVNATQHLNKTGWLLVEHGYNQATAVAAIFNSPCWQAVSQRQDIAGIVRCSGAKSIDC